MRLFITTYALYNNGKQFATTETGNWYDIDGSITYEDLAVKLALVQESFGLGSDVEMMATDYDDGPKELYEESVNSDHFEWIQKYNDLDEYEQVGFRYLVQDIGHSIEDALWKCGEVCVSTESPEDYAYNFIEQCYGYVPEFLRNYIDYDKFANDMKIEGSICEFEEYLITNAGEF